MKHQIVAVQTSVISGVILLLPTVVSAQNYRLMAPIGDTSEISSLAQYLTLLFNVTISVAGVLAVLMLVICGIKLMTSEAISSKGEAKACITNAIIGVLLALSSWAILNTINPDLVEQDLKIITSGYVPGTAAMPVLANETIPTMPGWYFQYKESAAGPTKFYRAAPERDTGDKCRQIVEKREEELKKNGGSVIPVNNEKCFLVRSTSQTVLSATEESVARQQICGYDGVDACLSQSTTGVYINNRACKDLAVKEAGCTSVAKMPISTINIIKSLRSAIVSEAESGSGNPTLPASCRETKIYITGGTEAGHSSHGPNLSPADLRLNTCLDTYIKTRGYITSSKTAPPRYNSTPPYPNGAPSCLNKTSGWCGFQKWYLDVGGTGYWFILETTGDTHWHICQHQPSQKGGFCGDTL